jgi:predicted nuclease of predicted toxin-antitoxin system
VRLLADEGVDFPIVKHLRNEGHDVISILEIDPGVENKKVLSHAANEDRIVLTSDKDFGNIVVHQDSRVGGVILLRLAGLSPTKKAQIVTDMIAEKAEELRGHFTVVGPEKVRMRALRE